MANYANTSPWAKTPITNFYLDLLTIRPVSAHPDDQQFVLTPHYHRRPDLLAYDMYGTSKLWWVFIQRNMDVLSDPIYDFNTGVKIYLPQKEQLIKVLGL